MDHILFGIKMKMTKQVIETNWGMNSNSCLTPNLLTMQSNCFFDYANQLQVLDTTVKKYFLIHGSHEKKMEKSH